MAEMKHTPGPWVYSGRLGFGHLVNPNIAVAYGGASSGRQDSGEANAHLIAAAPDMYEALRTTSANIRSLGPAGALDDVPMPYREWLKVVEDALSKAEGRSNA